MSTEANFTPKMIGIICNWCCYGGADLCGVSRFQYPPYIRLIRVMCSARVDMKHIFRAFLNGADAMFVGGCHLDDCHYITHGNYEAISMVQLSRKLLEHIGINPKRLRIEWVSAGEGIRFANIMNEFGAEIEKLGPLGKSEGISEIELTSRLEEVTKLIPYIKLAKRDKLTMHIRDNHEAYYDLYTCDEIAQLFSEVPSYYIDPQKCQACMTCARRCPVEAVISAKGQIHVIDQEKCIKCGTCFEACPPRFSSIRKIVGEPVQTPVPEGERAVVRKNKEKIS
ncbi:MAG: NADP-reducing hydrogenase subunit HndC [Pelotomaculum sp. PtaB.Bin104]|nr:MAG: NADP-reducing hydrogenase subunit HndC [Pelotomaculum sp. PtaB.Bin104]